MSKKEQISAIIKHIKWLQSKAEELKISLPDDKIEEALKDPYAFWGRGKKLEELKNLERIISSSVKEHKIKLKEEDEARIQKEEKAYRREQNEKEWAEKRRKSEKKKVQDGMYLLDADEKGNPDRKQKEDLEQLRKKRDDREQRYSGG